MSAEARTAILRALMTAIRQNIKKIANYLLVYLGFS
jgi:hypothetical protein